MSPKDWRYEMALRENATKQLEVQIIKLKKFNEDFAGNVAKADKNWPGLVKKNGK